MASAGHARLQNESPHLRCGTHRCFARIRQTIFPGGGVQDAEWIPTFTSSCGTTAAASPSSTMGRTRRWSFRRFSMRRGSCAAGAPALSSFTTGTPRRPIVSRWPSRIDREARGCPAAQTQLRRSSRHSLTVSHLASAEVHAGSKRDDGAFGWRRSTASWT